MYLTYDDYLDYGGTLDEATFNDYAFEAEAQINWYTFNRLQSMNYTAIDQKVKRCMYSLIGKIAVVQNFFNTGGGTGSGTSAVAGIASQSNDGVSISYNVLSAADAVDAAKGEIERMINLQLQGVVDSLGRKVLYRGLYPGE